MTSCTSSRFQGHDLFLSLLVLSSNQTAARSRYIPVSTCLVEPPNWRQVSVIGKTHYHIEGECCDITHIMMSHTDRGDLSCRATKLASGSQSIPVSIRRADKLTPGMNHHGKTQCHIEDQRKKTSEINFCDFEGGPQVVNPMMSWE
ncbi:unnamed protein product [Timema podura]|uniref:Uncharacterized protein n=1 Tax=Timema podura TaxID=61482 RepID=A0ABN7P9H4_TIMPD|nr:unnamed protein product [Timema podura]